MGKVTSDDLFGPNEQVIFDFYERNKTRYSKALDIGANIGIHSILMARNGWEVKSYEPDPEHCQRLRENLQRNEVKVEVIEAAVSVGSGLASFVRVEDNLTANHLLGARRAYGPTELVSVKTCVPEWDWADLAKLDCEGSEASILLMTTPEQMKRLEMIVEVGSKENAARIYAHFSEMGIPLWSQKTGWREVKKHRDMPKSYKEGSLFIGQSW